MFEWKALGSGFFYSPTSFLTCNHVVNGTRAPHVDGDDYILFQNLEGTISAVEILGARVGSEVHLFPEADAAVLKLPPSAKRDCWASLDYGYVWEGREIGVAGYPIPTLQTINNQLALNGLIFRVAKGEVTARYVGNFMSDGAPIPMTGMSVIEVNFLFVPGNSGGPIFDASRGQALGFVHGFSATKARERIEDANAETVVPAGINRSYIARVDAIYSVGFKLDRVQNELERLA